jgi:hypothetical protein
MANIRLKELLEANVDPKLVARSKESGKLVYFKTPQAKDAALKAGSHLDPKSEKGSKPNVDAKPNDMFGADYKKDRGGEAPKDDTDWMDDLDSIDTSDIKGKADPNADSFTSNDLYGATFKDPKTGKTITVGDAYEREDDSEAYKKAFAYVSKFDPDKEAVMGTQAYDDLNKKSEPTPKIVGNWKDADEDGRMSSDAADDVRNHLNNILGVDGMAEVDFGSGNIVYGLSDSENGIYVGSENGTYNVSYEGPSIDIDTINKSYKSFKNPKDALIYAGELAKVNRKGLEQKYTDTEPSSKLTSMLPKDAIDGPKINGKDQTTPNRMFDKKKPFDPKEIEKDVTDMLQSDGYEVKHQWGTNDYFLNISKKDKKGKEVERYTVQKDPKTGMADVWDAVAKTWVVEGEPSISRLYDTIGQIPYFRED